MGPPPPGTLLWMLEAISGVMEAGLLATAAAMTRVSARMRINSFIIRSPSNIPD
jgi:hypothetical protein